MARRYNPAHYCHEPTIHHLQPIGFVDGSAACHNYRAGHVAVYSC
ncbi:Uncharacterised protein [Vibrio cholerae]|nr:Uncharacterised protein [Vibrio cholerae]